MVTLKAHILPHHDLQPPGCRGSYEGLHVLKIEIKSVGEVCHFENSYYIRQGTATHLITDGEAISSLHRLYYS